MTLKSQYLSYKSHLGKLLDKLVKIKKFILKIGFLIISFLRESLLNEFKRSINVLLKSTLSLTGL
jgi:hypothetical protein